MGTRGAWGFRLDGTDKVTYNHWDSYPEGLGATIMEFVKAVPASELRQIAAKLILVDERGKPTQAQITTYSKLADTGVGSQSVNDWYCLLRGAQFHPEVYRKKTYKHMIDNSRFLGESLFCEWAYIINLDSGMLEVYEGFNCEESKPDDKGNWRHARKTGRYWDKSTQEAASGGRTYYGVSLLAEIGLGEIRGLSEDEIKRKCSELQKETDE